MCRVEKTITDILMECELLPPGYGITIGGDIHIGDIFHVSVNGKANTYRATAGRGGGVDYSSIERRILLQFYRQYPALRGRNRHSVWYP